MNSQLTEPAIAKLLESGPISMLLAKGQLVLVKNTVEDDTIAIAIAVRGKESTGVALLVHVDRDTGDIFFTVNDGRPEKRVMSDHNRATAEFSFLVRLVSSTFSIGQKHAMLWISDWSQAPGFDKVFKVDDVVMLKTGGTGKVIRVTTKTCCTVKLEDGDTVDACATTLQLVP